MSNRNFDNRAIILRLQQKNYARNLYTTQAQGKNLITNPQNSDGDSSRYNTFASGAQTTYTKGLLGGVVTPNFGGTFGVPPYIAKK
jgi:hypothetical protein